MFSSSLKKIVERVCYALGQPARPERAQAAAKAIAIYRGEVRRSNCIEDIRSYELGALDALQRVLISAKSRQIGNRTLRRQLQPSEAETVRSTFRQLNKRNHSPTARADEFPELSNLIKQTSSVADQLKSQWKASMLTIFGENHAESDSIPQIQSFVYPHTFGPSDKQKIFARISSQTDPFSDVLSKTLTIRSFDAFHKASTGRGFGKEISKELQ